jgi:hypothetical protein
MTLAIILVIIAVLSLAIILGTVASRSLQPSHRDGSPGQIEPIDVEAFRNLTNPDEDEYLRLRLPASEFRAVRRQRLHAMAAYVSAAGRNAAVLVRIGQNAMLTGDPRAAEAGRQLVDDASLLRKNVAIALFRIWVALAWPYSSFAAAPVLRGYERLSGRAMLLGRLQNPSAPVRI